MGGIYGVRLLWIVSLIMNYATAWVPIFHYSATGDTIKILVPKESFNVVAGLTFTSYHFSFQNLFFHCMPEYNFPFGGCEYRVIVHVPHGLGGKYSKWLTKPVAISAKMWDFNSSSTKNSSRACSCIGDRYSGVHFYSSVQGKIH